MTFRRRRRPIVWPQLFGCGYCHQTSFAGPPHGDQPCPLKTMVDDAYVSMLGAQQAAYERQGFAMNDMAATFRQALDDDSEAGS